MPRSEPTATAKVKKYQLEIFHDRCPEHSMTFCEVAALYLITHQDAWRNATHRKQWDSALRDSTFPVLGDLPVARIDTGAVMAAPQQHSHTRIATAKKLQGGIERVIDFAKARGWRRGANSAQGWRELPAIGAELTTRADLAVLPLRFLIATA
jgi:hypothetical protein